MRNKFIYSAVICVGVLASSLPLSAADTFAVKLGQTSLGELIYDSASGGATVRSTLANTPMGVFNGTFVGTSRPDTSDTGDKVMAFVGISESSRKSRKVQVQIGAQGAVATTVTPTSEETDLSDPAQAPKGVMDPVQAIGHLLSASGCPEAINIYDGRRAIALVPGDKTAKDGMLTCNITYKVTAGPGHLSPLRVSKAKMRVTYEMGDDSQKVTQIRLGSGVFNLVLERMK